MRTGYDEVRGLMYDEYESWELQDNVIIHADHAYVDKKWVNGKWRYYYDVAKAGFNAGRDAVKKGVNSLRENYKIGKAELDSRVKSAKDRLVSIVANAKSRIKTNRMNKNADKRAAGVARDMAAKQAASDQHRKDSQARLKTIAKGAMVKKQADFNKRWEEEWHRRKSEQGRQAAIEKGNATKANAQGRKNAVETGKATREAAQARRNEEIRRNLANEVKTNRANAAADKRGAGYAKDYQRAYQNSSTGKQNAQNKRESGYAADAAAKARQQSNEQARKALIARTEELRRRRRK